MPTRGHWASLWPSLCWRLPGHGLPGVPCDPRSGTVVLAWPLGRLPGGSLCSPRLTSTSSKQGQLGLRPFSTTHGDFPHSALTWYRLCPAPSVPSSRLSPQLCQGLACGDTDAVLPAESRHPTSVTQTRALGLGAPGEGTAIMGAGLRGDQIPWPSLSIGPSPGALATLMRTRRKLGPCTGCVRLSGELL